MSLLNCSYDQTVDPLNAISLPCYAMTPGKVFTESNLVQDSINNDTYHSWDHHTSYSSLSISQMLIAMNRDIVAAHENLISAKVLFVTLGTARVHILNASNQVVSNCHKQPSHMFTKKLLSVDEIVTSLRESLLLCRTHNPNLKVHHGNARTSASFYVEEVSSILRL